MKRCLLLGSVFVGFAVDADATPTQQSDAFIQGNIVENCIFDDVSGDGADGVNISQTETGLSVNFNTIVDPETAELVPFGLIISLNMTCNFAHTVRVRSASGGLQASDPSNSDSFTDRADYTVEAQWAGQSAGFSTSGTPGEGAGLQIGGLNAGRFDLEIGSAASSLPLVAGDYTDTLIIEIAGTP